MQAHKTFWGCLGFESFRSFLGFWIARGLVPLLVVLNLSSIWDPVGPWEYVAIGGGFLAFPIVISALGARARPARKSDLWGYLVIAAVLALAACVFWIKVRT